MPSVSCSPISSSVRSPSAARRAAGWRIGLRSRAADGAERGTVTAELAVALPAVLLVLVLCVGAIRLAAEQVRLVGLSADAARMIARGDDESTVRTGLATATSAMATTDRSADGTVCVDLVEPARLGPIAIGRLGARECSLGEP